MTVLDIVLLALFAGAVFAALRGARKARKNGGCGCGCSGCTKKSACPQNCTRRDADDTPPPR